MLRRSPSPFLFAVALTRPVVPLLAGIRRPGAAAPTRRHLVFTVLIALLGASFVANVGMGAVDISPAAVLGILCKHAGVDIGVAFTAQQDAVLWNIRLPRVVLAVCVGGGLALAGAALQAIFRNPLADSGLIGASSGAALGAIGLIVLGFAPIGQASIAVAAFAGALVATFFVYTIARSEGRTEVVTLILTGVAMNAIAGGLIGLMNFVATDAQLRTIVFWSLGSLGGATWDQVIPVAVLVAVGSGLLLRLATPLNLMALGESEAYHLGVSTERLRLQVIALSALVAGTAVAVAGIVGFVGLVIPHLLRLLIGPDHRYLLPASPIAGAALLLLADLFARTVVIPRELPLGVVTALIGGPYFLFILVRTRRQQGGWG